MPIEFHLVPHTHWDREWYRTAAVFRQRLVDLIDELIEAPPREGEAFLLDGQAIVIGDYLEVRPAAGERLRALIQSGRIEAGPWYVLADELIPGGEALVRNLLLGRHVLAGLGAASPPVLYCPDSFGHPAALPEIANGFGLPLIVLWRGYGGARWPRGDVVRWVAPSGADALVYHLPPDGYEFASSLPLDEAGAKDRWRVLREALASRSTVGVTLLQNGADHHARQSGHREAGELLARVASEGSDRIVRSSLRAFADAVVQRAAAQRLPSINGELRDSYGYTWTLQGTFGTRAAQKRANAIAERALGGAESWAALAWLATGRPHLHHLRAAWKTLLEAHPHDTLCGTSIDDVAAAMDVRVRSAELQARAIADRARALLMEHDPAASREAPSGQRHDRVLLENAAAYARGGVVIVEEIEKVADEPVGPGSAGGPSVAALRESAGVPPAPPKGRQLLATSITRDRDESPRHYPDNDIVRSSLVARYIAPLPGMSLRVADDDAPPVATVKVGRASVESGGMTLRLGRDGGIALGAGGRDITGLIGLEDREDAGDLYTPSVRDVAAVGRLVRQRVVHRGPLIGEFVQEWGMFAQGSKSARALVALSLRLVADSPLFEVSVSGTNESDDHRLRIGFRSGIASPRVFADAAFGPVERSIVSVGEDELRMEKPSATAPLHRYVSLFGNGVGFTLHSDGLAEYEVDADGIIWVTLVRAVGELSRNDLPERPGHAGWPESTPAAQSRTSFEARFAVQLHEGPGPATHHLIERESDRFLTPLRGRTLRNTITPRVSAGSIELSGTALSVSAIKESEDGRSVVLRCVNRSDREQAGTWTLPANIAAAHLARLDETPTGEAAVSDGKLIRFTAPPRAVVTILVIPER